MGDAMIALTADEVSEIAPNGVIKVGIAVGPAASAVWAIRDAETGKPGGVTVDLATELSRLMAVVPSPQICECGWRVWASVMQGLRGPVRFGAGMEATHPADLVGADPLRRPRHAFRVEICAISKHAGQHGSDVMRRIFRPDTSGHA